MSDPLSQESPGAAGQAAGPPGARGPGRRGKPGPVGALSLRPTPLEIQGIVAPVAIVLLIGLTFVSVYLAAFHKPRPHDLPIGVVGTSSQVSQVETALHDNVKGYYKVTSYGSGQSARDAIEHRDIYAAYDLTGKTPELLYAGANGAAVSGTTTATFQIMSKAQGKPLVTTDIRPISPDDSRGLSLFYATFGLVLAGFLFGLISLQQAPRLSFAFRWVSLALFGILGGFFTVLIANTGYGAMPGSFWGEFGVIALVTAASGAITLLIVRVAGNAGLALSSIILITFGNTTSGGVMPPDFLPGWLRPLSDIMPPGVATRAMYGIAYFHNDGAGSGVAILITWIVGSALIIYLLNGRAEMTKLRQSQNRPGQGAGPSPAPGEVAEAPAAPAPARVPQPALATAGAGAVPAGAASYFSPGPQAAPPIPSPPPAPAPETTGISVRADLPVGHMARPAQPQSYDPPVYAEPAPYEQGNGAQGNGAHGNGVQGYPEADHLGADSYLGAAYSEPVDPEPPVTRPQPYPQAPPAQPVQSVQSVQSTQSAPAEIPPPLPIETEPQSWFRPPRSRNAPASGGTDWAVAGDSEWRHADSVVSEPVTAGSTASGLPIRTPGRNQVAGEFPSDRPQAPVSQPRSAAENAAGARDRVQTLQRGIYRAQEELQTDDDGGSE